MKRSADNHLHMQRIFDVLAEHSRKTPTEIAVTDGEIRLSYVDLEKSVNRYARGLMAAGVAKGDRVGTLAPPSADFWIQFLAVSMVGGIWLGINPKYKARDNQFVLSHATPKVIFSISPFDNRNYDLELQSVAPPDILLVTHGEPKGTAVDLDAFLEQGNGITQEQLDDRSNGVLPSDIAAITYTSGTTGVPKGAMLSHKAICGAAKSCNAWMGDALESVVMGAPINHVGALCNLCMNVLYHGGKIVFMRQVLIETFLSLGETENTRLLPLSHTVFGMLLDCPTFTMQRMNHGRLLIHGGAKTTVSMLSRFASLPAKIAAVYGQTETTGIVTYTRPEDSIDVHANTLGRAADDVELRLVDPATDELITERDKVGELQVRCDFIFTGYFRDPAATAKTITPDGFVRTGDLCKLRTDGNYELIDRMKLMFKSGGYNVYPAEVEQAIGEHPSIKEVVVLAIPDEKFSEVGFAFVACRAGENVTEAELVSFLRERMANFKIPKQFRFLDQLPTLPNLKHDRQALKDLLSKELVN